jgi:hypothetical protein
MRMLSIEIPKGIPPHRMAEAEEEALSEFYKHPDYDVENKKWAKTDMQELLDSGESDDYKKLF